MKTSHLVIEKLCRCYKHAMRSCRKHFEADARSHGSVTSSNRCRTASRTPVPPLCKTARGIRPRLHYHPSCRCSICITSSATSFEMVSSVSQACFALLQSPQHFAEHPDLVEEYFYLASRFLDYCPGSFCYLRRCWDTSSSRRRRGCGSSIAKRCAACCIFLWGVHGGGGARAEEVRRSPAARDVFR